MEEDYEEERYEAQGEEGDNEFIENEAGRELALCPICNRKFHPDRVDRHQEACQRAHAKQHERDKIIKKKQRQIEEKKTHGVPAKAVKNWREEHQKFQELIQYNRKLKELQSKGEDTSQVKPPEVTVNSTYVYCEHCQRHFAPRSLEVAERHIPKCKETIAKPKPPRKTLAEKNPLAKRATQISTASSSGTSQMERAIRKQASDSSQQFRPASLQKMMKTTDYMKQNKGLPEIRNANWTNLGFVDCQSRATAIQDVECPHCKRKFTSRAAERHLPICEKLTRKQLFQIKPQRGSSKTAAKSMLPQIVKSVAQSSNLNLNQFCTECGSRFQVNHKFCGGCGHKRD